MPTNQFSLRPPFEPYLPHLSPAKSVGQANFDIKRLVTLGLHEHWEPILGWAEKNGVVPELLLAANTTRTLKEVHKFTALLSVLSLNENNELLRLWAQSSDAAKYLKNLSDARINDSKFFENYYSVPTEVSAKKQFLGELERQFLIALLSEGFPRALPQSIDWLNTLRMWVLVHAIDRALTGNFLDGSIRLVSRKLSNALSQSGQWRVLVLSLHSFQNWKLAVEEFDTLSRFIAHSASSMLDKNLHPHITDTQKKLLKTVIKVASRRHDQINIGDESVYAYIPLKQIFPLGTASPVISIGAEIGNEANEYLVEADSEYTSPDADADADFLGSKNDNELSFSLQKLKGTGLQIFCIEELQFLPLSWSKINSYESTQIEKWIFYCLESSQQELRFIASVVQMAINYGRSLKRTLNIRISRSPAEKEWSFNPDNKSFERKPPRRIPGWHPETEVQERWVAKDAGTQSIVLPTNIVAVLIEQLGMFPDAKYLGELWSTRWGGSPYDLFAREFQKIAPRVTGGMLSSSLPQKIHEDTSDHVFSRLLSSLPNAALPGACSYCSWPTTQISAALGRTAKLQENEEAAIDNAMGGLLDPIELLVINSIRLAGERVKRLREENDVIAFHNAYTAYLIAALLAGTGGRPIVDPFESNFHFDFDRKFVFACDKDTGNLREARLIPLPDELCSMIKDDYLCHLHFMEKIVRENNLELATLMHSLTIRGEPARMPFFFFLSRNARSWKSVSENEIGKLELFEWPIPLNHFRHRLPRLLRKLKVDIELIDSILGHAEAGSLTHGDFSFRVWLDDMDMIRKDINGVFDTLKFVRFQGCSGESIKLSAVEVSEVEEIKDREFGIKAREKRRSERVKAVIRDAANHIHLFLGDRENLSDITQDEVDKLSREMLFNSKGLPHVNGYLKYRVLLKRIEKEWKKSGKKVKFSKRYSRFPEEHTPFSLKAPGAMSLFIQMVEACKAIDSSQASKGNLSDCAVIFVTLLCLENRISCKQMLDHALADKYIHLVVLKKAPHLEYAEKPDDCIGDVPVKQFALSMHAALCHDLYRSREREIKVERIPSTLEPIASILQASRKLPQNYCVQEFIHAIADVVGQANAISLPGIVAGYLGGRVDSFSLPWQDRARLELGYPVQIGKSAEENNEAEKANKLVSLISAKAGISSPGKSSPIELQQNARQMLIALRACLTGRSASVGKSSTSIGRRDLSRQIQDVIEKFDGTVSTSIMLLAKWIQSILFRKVRKKLLDISSVHRYLSALSGIFEEIAHSADLLSMDDEDVTFLYGNLILSSSATNTQYVARRLSEFHRWAKREYTVEDPEWGELPDVFFSSGVSPGIITEAEYHKALTLLLSIDEKDNRLRLAAPMLSLLCFRFGLRCGEARGLLRSDVILLEKSIIILVQNNRFRELKTLPSRRQVPLLFNLSDQEMSLLDGWFAEAAALHGNDMGQPLFSNRQTDDGLMSISKIRERVIAALRLATSNHETVLHHARHSFANFIGIALANVRHPTWDGASSLCGNPSNADVDKILLGNSGITRRKIWGISRPLGHSRRETTCGSYIHFLGSWADTFNTHAKSYKTAPIFRNALNLDDLPRMAEINTNLLELIKPRAFAPSTTQILKLLRLLARGGSIFDAARNLGIGESHAKELESLIETIGKKLRICKVKAEGDKNDSASFIKLLQKLKEPAWNRLIEFSDSVSKKSSENLPEVDIENIADMIGANRQILLWEEKHFSLLAAFIRHFEIKKEDYRFIRSVKTTMELEKLPYHFGFATININEVGVKKFQLDVARCKAGALELVVESRYGFVVKENNCHVLRNSHELIVAFVAFSVECAINPSLISTKKHLS